MAYGSVAAEGGFQADWFYIGAAVRIDGGIGSWKVTRISGGFRFEVESGVPLAPGWYGLRLLNTDIGLSHVRFVFDYGDGYWSSQSSEIPKAIRIGSSSHGLLLVRRPLFGLRMDYVGGSGAASGLELRLRSVSKFTAFAIQAIGILLSKPLPNLAVGIRAFRSRGVRGFGSWIYNSYLSEQTFEFPDYGNWLSLYDGESFRRPASPQKDTLFSILLPTFNTNADFLIRCLESVLAQTYQEWELCICDDASDEPHVWKIVSEYATRDRRIKLSRLEVNSHIASASNHALEASVGQYVVLLDHDDELHPRALEELACAVSDNPHWDLVYSDEDKIGFDGVRSEPYFKPDFNLDLLRSHNCVCHLAAYKRNLVVALGGFRLGLEGSQDWDLALRVFDAVGHDRIGHIPKVLYHWRVSEGSTALSSDVKPYAREAAKVAIADHLSRNSFDGAKVYELAGYAGRYRVIFPLDKDRSSVSILVYAVEGAREQILQECLMTLLAEASRFDMEIHVGYRTPAEVRVAESLFEQAQISWSLINIDQQGWSGACNKLADASTKSVLLFLSSDTLPLSPDWLEELLRQASRTDVAFVAPKIYDSSWRIRGGGYFLDSTTGCVRAYQGMPAYFCDQPGRAVLTQNFSALAGECLAVRGEVFRALGGFDLRLGAAAAGVDMSLKARESGYLNVWTAFSEMEFQISRYRTDVNDMLPISILEQDHEVLLSRWAKWLHSDPAYNPNLELSPSTSRFAFPPRSHSSLMASAAAASHCEGSRMSNIC